MMLSRFILPALVFLLSLYVRDAGAQQDTAGRFVIYSDTVYVGKFYTVISTDKSEKTCKLLGVNPDCILVFIEGETETINKEDIIRIKPFIPAGTDRRALDKGFRSISQIYIGAGVLFPSNSNNSIYSAMKYTTGFNLYAGFLTVMSRNAGIRTDLDIVYVPKQEGVVENRYSKETYEGGSAGGFSVRCNFLLGDFLSSDFNFAFMVGFGGCVGKTGASSYKQEYYSEPNYNIISNSGSRTVWGIVASFGASANFSLSPDIRVFVEPQMTYWGGDVPNHFIIRAGVIL